MSITFSGAYSGIDTASIISQLVYLEGAPVRALNQDKSNYQSQLKIIQNVNSKLQTLQTKAEALKTIGNFLSYSAESSDEDKVTATATGTAVPGTYKIEVSQLATAERTYSGSFDHKDVEGEAGTGTLTITVGDDDPVEVEVNADDTLETIVSNINASDARVTAGLFYDGTHYRIQVTGSDTGADNEIEFDETASLSLGLEGATAYQEAKDATLKIDDFPVTSADNEIENAVAGVSISLKDTTTSAVELVISPDEEAIKTKIQELVTAYNDVMGLIHSEFAYSGETKGSDHLAGDQTLRSLQLQLSRTITSSIEDLGTTFESLSQIGISTGTDGKLSIDSSDLSDAIASDTVGVGRLFSGSADQEVDGIADLFDDLVDRFVDFSDGILTTKKNGINNSIKNINSSVLRYQARVDKYEEQLRKQFTDMEIMMSTLSSQSNYLAGLAK